MTTPPVHAPERILTADDHPDTLAWTLIPEIEGHPFSRGLQIAKTPTAVYLRTSDRPYVMIVMTHEQYEAFMAFSVREARGEEPGEGGE